MRRLEFNNGEFKIMQIADVQELPAISADTQLLISLALEREKPDLAVFTGDQLQGYAREFNRGDPLPKVRKLIDAVLEPVVSRDIPFAVTFGNHDRQCRVPNCAQMELYKAYPQCVWGEPCGAADRGTYSFTLYSGNTGRGVFNIYMIDSNGLTPHNGYAPVNKRQIQWFRRERERLCCLHGRYLPSFVFQHIPVPEIFDGLVRCRRGDKGAVPAFRTHAGQYYRLPRECEARGEFMLESPGPPDENCGEFDALCEKGDIKGLFFGHDHSNSFTTTVRGVMLGYTQGAGFNVYGPHTNRGVRVFKLHEASPESFETYTLTYRQLTDKLPEARLYELINANMPYALVKRAYSRLMNHSGLFPM